MAKSKKKLQNGKQQTSQNGDISSLCKELSLKETRVREKLIDELLKKCTYYANNTSAKLVDEFFELNNIIQKICEVEKSIDIPFHDRDKHWSEFIEWCKNNKIDCSCFEIAKIDDINEYGLVAKKDLTTADLIITVPKKMMMTYESAKQDSVLNFFIAKDQILQQMPNIVLTLHLISEYCKSDSFWGPYLNILPSSYSTILYCNEEEILELDQSFQLEEAVKMIRSIARQYAHFYFQMQGNNPGHTLHFKKKFTFELYRWAASTVMTRQNAVPSADGAMISALIPLWDLFNHEQGKFSTDFSLEQNAAVCYAMRDFKAGQQIFIFYGPRSNGDFVIHNGFIYDDNEHDWIPLKLGMGNNKSDELCILRSQLCSNTGLKTSGIFRLHEKDKAIDRDLLAFLRIFHMTKETLSSYLKMQPTDAKERLGDISNSDFVDIDSTVQQFLAVRCGILLKRYKTKQPSANAAPESALTNKLSQNISRLISCEKQILQSYL